MTFSEFMDLADQAATVIGLPLYFGDDAMQNVYADRNFIDQVYLTVDCTGANQVGGALGLFVEEPTRSIVIQCLSTSYYAEDDLKELECLKVTDMYLSKVLKYILCRASTSRVGITKVQNIYNSKKSGWRASFELEGF